MIDDVATAQRSRHELLEQNALLTANNQELRQQIRQAREGRDKWWRECQDLRQERNEARAQVQELQMRGESLGWQVAHLREKVRDFEKRAGLLEDSIEIQETKSDAQL